MDKIDARLGRRKAEPGEMAVCNHNCMNCRFRGEDDRCVKYGDECRTNHHCVSWDMTYQAEAALRKVQKEKYGK